MNTQHLQYVIEVEKAGSITQAAQNLYIAQPNLSKAIKDLEEEIGFDIFKRSSSGIKLTEKGTEFICHAKKMLEQLKEIELISGKNGIYSKRYKISIPRGSYIANGFTSFVAELEFLEGMELTVNETNAMSTITDVTEHGYNMGIIRYSVKDEAYFNGILEANNLLSEVIWEFEYVLVMSEKHPLAKKEHIYEEDLFDYIKIAHGDIDIHPFKSEPNNASDKKGAGTVYVYERGSQFDLLNGVNTTYMWVSPIPQKYLKKFGLVQRVCKIPQNRYRDVLIYRSDYEFGELDKLFQKKTYESKVEVASFKFH